MTARISTGLAYNMLAQGMSLVMASGVIEIYDGFQPDTADLAESGNLLVVITPNSLLFNPSLSQMLFLTSPSGGILSKNTSQTWSGIAVASGYAGWARFYDQAYVHGADTSGLLNRIDFSCNSGELALSNYNIVAGETIVIDAFSFGLLTS